MQQSSNRAKELRKKFEDRIAQEHKEHQESKTSHHVIKQQKKDLNKVLVVGRNWNNTNTTNTNSNLEQRPKTGLISNSTTTTKTPVNTITNSNAYSNVLVAEDGNKLLNLDSKEPQKKDDHQQKVLIPTNVSYQHHLEEEDSNKKTQDLDVINTITSKPISNYLTDLGVDQNESLDDHSNNESDPISSTIEESSKTQFLPSGYSLVFVDEDSDEEGTSSSSPLQPSTSKVPTNENAYDPKVYSTVGDAGNYSQNLYASTKEDQVSLQTGTGNAYDHNMYTSTSNTGGATAYMQVSLGDEEEKTHNKKHQEKGEGNQVNGNNTLRYSSQLIDDETPVSNGYAVVLLNTNDAEPKSTNEIQYLNEKEGRKKKKEKKEKRKKKARDRTQEEGSKQTMMYLENGLFVVKRVTPGKQNKANTTDLYAFDNSARDWNQEYQKLIESAPTVQVAKSLVNLSQEFVRTASIYGQIIISELFLPTSAKTIPPAAVGGIAGGDKYCHKGIFFKVAHDVLLSKNPEIWMYGMHNRSDELANKSTAHEIKSIMACQEAQIPGIYFPLICIVDYFGFRLLCVSMLPISKNTIKYGSNDAGTTMHNDDVEASEKMKKLGDYLKLKGHQLVSIDKKQKVILHGPGDIEGHLGDDDGRYYLVDLARMFPPEARIGFNKGTNPRSIFYNLLRPELLKNATNPLSSDVYSAWSLGDPDRKIHVQEVVNETRRLHEVVIPQLATELDKTAKTWTWTRSSTDGIRSNNNSAELLVSTVHRAGVNLRHLSVLYKEVKEETVKRIIMMEMVVRTLKVILYDQLREAHRNAGLGNHTEEKSGVKAIITNFLNSILCNFREISHRKGETITKRDWSQFIITAVQVKYNVDLEAVRSDGYAVEYCLYQKSTVLVRKLCKKVGISLSERVLTALDKGDTQQIRTMYNTLVHQNDIKRISTHIKRAHTVELAGAEVMCYEGFKCCRREPERARKLLEKGRTYLMKSIKNSKSFTDKKIQTLQLQIYVGLLRCSDGQAAQQIYTTASEVVNSILLKFHTESRSPEFNLWNGILLVHDPSLQNWNNDPSNIDVITRAKTEFHNYIQQNDQEESIDTLIEHAKLPETFAGRAIHRFFSSCQSIAIYKAILNTKPNYMQALKGLAVTLLCSLKIKEEHLCPILIHGVKGSYDDQTDYRDQLIELTGHACETALQYDDSCLDEILQQIELRVNIRTYDIRNWRIKQIALETVALVARYSPALKERFSKLGLSRAILQLGNLVDFNANLDLRKREATEVLHFIDSLQDSITSVIDLKVPLNGQVIDALSKCPNLTHLDVCPQSELMESISKLGQLKFIKSLRIKQGTDGQVSSILTNVPPLDFLELNECSITDAGIDSIVSVNLTSVRSLKGFKLISCYEVTDPKAVVGFQNPSFTILDASTCYLPQAGYNFEQNPAMKSLVLSGVPSSVASQGMIYPIHTWNRLESISIDLSSFTYDDTAKFCEQVSLSCAELTSLAMVEGKMGELSMRKLLRIDTVLHKLQILSITTSSTFLYVDNNDEEKLEQNSSENSGQLFNFSLLPNLETLILRLNVRFDDNRKHNVFIQSLYSSYKDEPQASLKKLSVETPPNSSDEAAAVSDIECLLHMCQLHLTHIHLFLSTGRRRELLIALSNFETKLKQTGERKPTLRQLFLNQVASDKVVELLSKTFEQLEYISLEGFDLTEKSIVSLAESNVRKSLRFFVLGSNQGATQGWIEMFKSTRIFKKLEYLILSGFVLHHEQICDLLEVKRVRPDLHVLASTEIISPSLFETSNHLSEKWKEKMIRVEHIFDDFRLQLIVNNK